MGGDDLSRSLRCSVCGSVMLIEDPHNLECLQIIRARCPKNCRGSDIVQERRHPNMPPVREFDWKAEAKRDQHSHNHNEFYQTRTFVCAACGAQVTTRAHPRTQTCSEECKKHLNRITAHKRWVRIQNAKKEKHSRKLS